MVEPVINFPLTKLRDFTYLTLDVMMHIEYEKSKYFMFAINKQGRLFLQNNFYAIRNGFINDGLIPFQWEFSLDSFLQLEKLYLNAINRIFTNRVLNISINFNRFNFRYFNEVLNQIKLQNHQYNVNCRLNVKVYADK